jgi:glycosyltransferase involved in cell wall biosynthesis
MAKPPVRVALFPDSFHEVNGVANTCRNFAEFARSQELPFLVICAEEQNQVTQDGSVTRVGLRRGRVSFGLEKDLRFDVLYLRHYERVVEALRKFQPDVVHITGPSDVGIIGAIAGHRMGIPVCASWHTNLHEYAARRSETVIPRWIKQSRREQLMRQIENWTFRASALYFKAGRFHFAPNRELIDKLRAATHKPCYLMERGVDHVLFSPAKRDRADDGQNKDGQIVVGYVGRLSTEKKVRSFAEIADAVRAAGHANVKFVFVGHGRDRDWLLENVKGAQMTGVLRGEALATAYANMDLFAFPSETDTFGNVVLEALAAGVPAVVTNQGGPKFIVEHRKSGFVAKDNAQFIDAVVQLVKDPSLRKTMAVEARERALRASWTRVFSSVYDAYREQLPQTERAAEQAPVRAMPAASTGAQEVLLSSRTRMYSGTDKRY